MLFPPTDFDGCEYNKEKGAFKGGSECINGERGRGKVSLL